MNLLLIRICVEGWKTFLCKFSGALVAPVFLIIRRTCIPGSTCARILDSGAYSPRHTSYSWHHSLFWCVEISIFWLSHWLFYYLVTTFHCSFFLSSGFRFYYFCISGPSEGLNRTNFCTNINNLLYLCTRYNSLMHIIEFRAANASNSFSRLSPL